MIRVTSAIPPLAVFNGDAMVDTIMAQSVEALDGAAVAKVRVQGRFYRPELDGLRFYAFLGVFICHTLPLGENVYRDLHLPAPSLWAAAVRSGGEGVDLFFALSAFLITSLLVRERAETGKISLRLFYIRRILRIWPLYFLVVALGILFAHTMTSVGWYYEQSLPWHYLFGYLFFISNWTYAAYGAAHSICGPLWTVSIEEQFYLLWPALMRNLPIRGMAIAAMLTLATATVSQAGIVLFGGSRGYISFGSASRCQSLALGVLLALYSDRLPRLSGLARLLLVVSGLTGWMSAAWWLSDQSGPASMRMVLGRVIASLASASVLYGCLHSASKILTGAWVVKLGKVSYGLYMLHFTGMVIVATLIRPLGRSQMLASHALAFVVTVLLALVSYRWIESPFLRLKDRFATVPSRPV
jgi:peptidoglycan/LPS O-acetylase OafA/YrhL